MNSVIVFFAEPLGYILLAFLLVFFWENRKKYPRFLFEAASAAFLSRGVVTEAIRFFWHNPRPFVEQGTMPLIAESPLSWSFPSGHATFFFALGAVLYSYNKKAGIAFLAFSGLMGIARVLAGVHWPLDIAGGAVIGMVSGFIVVRLFCSRGNRFFSY
ncbi:MAG: phosphatase PAP2 family protein [Candidatus Wildermuthbacteria bacterium]|nr:phosphatase PAP2 family protein [Candidatus Wildermuthbacteria bacterium]